MCFSTRMGTETHNGPRTCKQMEECNGWILGVPKIEVQYARLNWGICQWQSPYLLAFKEL